MNTHVFIPLIATVAYIPLFVILLANRPWQRKQKLFFLFLIPAILWSLSTIIFRSDFFAQEKLLLIKIVICINVWMLVQFHYFLHSFYQFGRTRIPLVYIFVVSTIVLATLGYIPQSIEVTARSINVEYGVWTIAVFLLFLFTIVVKDLYSLWQRYRISPDPAERNQIAYILSAAAILVIFISNSTTPRGGEYPVAHIGNLITAIILIYSVIAHRLLDIRIVLRRVLMYLGLYGTGVSIVALCFFLVHLLFGFKPDLATLAIVIGTGIPIILFLIHKVRKPWQNKVEQAFIGEKYDYRRHLSEFITKIHSIPTLEQFGRELTSLLCQSIGCRRAGLLLPEGGNGDFITRFTYPPVANNPMGKLKLRHNSPVAAWLKREKHILLERNLSVFPEFQSLWQQEKEEIESAKVEMFLPLINRGVLVAIVMVADRRDGKLYTVEDIDLLEFIARNVAESMEKQYSYAQLAEQDRELALVNRLTAIITSSPSVQDIFEGFANELKKLVDVDWATIALVEGDQLYFLSLSSTVGSAWQTGEGIPLKGTATEWVAREKKSLYEADLTRHARFWTGEHHLKQGIRSIVYLPLTLKHVQGKDKCIGSLILATHQANAYNPGQIRLLEKVAWQIAPPVENARLYLRVHEGARLDELTGLFNRRHFEERLKEEIARHSRHSGIFSLFLIDLDSFKVYNDIYGHPMGDELLGQIGRIIRSSIRGGDQAFRYGGDEFIVILPETTPDNAYVVAERLRGQMATEMGAKNIAVTCSIGLASYPSDGVMSGELVTATDTALYHAKQTGGNRVCLSAAILSEPVAEAGTYARGSELSVVYALAAAVDAKDPYTYGHSRKVNVYAVALAEAIGLSPDEVSKVSTAALLHDVGKIGIPDKVLNKIGKLGAEDWEAIKSHPRLGANIVGNVPSLVPCISGILYHHERWDGTGYPEGLKGEGIPLEARILAIADAFCAMASARPYRKAFSHEKAMEELRNGAGTQFDPKLIEVFIALNLFQGGFPEKVPTSG